MELSIQNFKDYIKNKLIDINELKTIQIYHKVIYNDYIKILEKDKYIDCYYYFINAKSNKYRNILKKRNITLNYVFIKKMAHECNLYAFKWILKNLDYINQYMYIDRKYFDIECYYYNVCYSFYNLPIIFEDFIFEYLSCFECYDFNLGLTCGIAFEKVKLLAKANIDINKNNLLERIYIETHNCNDWYHYNTFLLISLFVLNDNFNWDDIDPLIRIKILYDYYFGDWCNVGFYKDFPNIIKNKKIKEFLIGNASPEQYQITKKKVKIYEIKENLYHLYDYEKDDIDDYNKLDDIYYIEEAEDNDPYVFIKEPTENYSFEHTMYHFYDLQKQIINNQFIASKMCIYTRRGEM